MNKKTYFESKIKPLLTYVGTLGAILMSIAYIIAVFVLIFGFSAKLKMRTILAFAIANAVVGMIIMFLLKIQGKDFAKDLEENKPIHKLYYNKKTKDKKLHSMKFYWLTSTLKDLGTKVAGVVVSTTLLIRIVIKGTNDMSLLGLAFVNLIMFICFGLISLVNAYDYYNEYHVPYMKEQLEKAGIDWKKEIKNDIIKEEKKEEIQDERETLPQHSGTSREE